MITFASEESVEIGSLIHRQVDLSFHLPDDFRDFVSPVRQQASRRVSRRHVLEKPFPERYGVLSGSGIALESDYTLVVRLETVVPVATCLFMEGLAEETHGGVETGAESRENVVHWAFPGASEMQVGGIGPRRGVRLEDREVDAFVAVRQRVHLGEHDVVGESGVVLPGVVVL